MEIEPEGTPETDWRFVGDGTMRLHPFHLRDWDDAPAEIGDEARERLAKGLPESEQDEVVYDRIGQRLK